MREFKEATRDFKEAVRESKEATREFKDTMREFKEAIPKSDICIRSDGFSFSEISGRFGGGAAAEVLHVRGGPPQSWQRFPPKPPLFRRFSMGNARFWHPKKLFLPLFL